MSGKHSLVMKPERWHTRMYQLWLSLGGEKPKYKENLCRYFWIVLVRGPLRWFFLGRAKKVPPFLFPTVPLAVFAIAGVARRWTDAVLTTAKWAGIVIVVIVIIVIIGMSIAEVYDRWPAGVKKTFKYATIVFWILPYLIERAAVRAWKRLEDPIMAVLEAYIYGIRWPWLNPLGLTIVTAVAAFFYYETTDALKLLEVLGIIVGIAVAAVIVLGTIALANEAWSEDIKDSVNLAREYVSNKKQGSLICPFIEFEDAGAP